MRKRVIAAVAICAAAIAVPIASVSAHQGHERHDWNRGQIKHVC